MNACVRIFGVIGLVFAGGLIPPTRCTAADDAVVLNELMASNTQGRQDEQGQYDDWIELYNSTEVAIDVAGMFLTDDQESPEKWQIPLDSPSLTTIPAGGFLLIWADGDIEQGPLHAGFGLSADGDAVYLFDVDHVTLIDSIEYGLQYPDIAYGRYPDGSETWRSLGTASPGGANVAAYEGMVAPVEFSHDRGFCESPFELTLTCATPGATINYTVDGSDAFSVERQRGAGKIYEGPFIVFETTVIRAVATKPGWMPGPTATYSYLFVSDVISQSSAPLGFPSSWGSRSADYEMDEDIVDEPRYADQMEESLLSLPSMSLVMNVDDLFDTSQGIYTNSGNSGASWERAGSIELVYPDGRPGFQSNCGVRIQGGYFRTPGASSKKSFRLLFRGAYGATKLRYPLFGDDAAQEFDTVTLRGGANDGYTWTGNERYAQFTRDQFARDLQIGTGNAGPHGMFVHLYINGLYWGLYNPCERPDDAFSASYYGGEKEDWDAFKHKSFEVAAGNRSALNEMIAVCQEAGTSLAAYQELQGRNPDGSDNSDYPHLLDVSDYIDYMIVNMWAGNWDWPWNNYWLGRQRGADSTGFKFYCWDAEDIMLSSRSALGIDLITGADSRDVGRFHATLRQNPEYRVTFGDHLHQFFFNGGLLTSESLLDRYQELAGSIEMAIIPESARWGDQHGRNIDQDDWYTMRDRILDTYLPQRSSIVLQQFRNAGLYPNVVAPVFHVDGVYQHGGNVATGQTLSMEDASGTVWYTLDGSDPRVPQIDTSAGNNDASTLVPENATKRVLVPSADVDEAWKEDPDFDDWAWMVTGGGVGYERSTGYEPYFDLDLGDLMYGSHTGCYIRIPFDVSEETLAGLSNLILKVRYDDGFIAYINGVEVTRSNFSGDPTWASAAITQNSDLNAIDLEPFDVTAAIDHLRPGQNLLAIHALNIGTTSSDFLFSATLGAAQGTSEGGGSVSAKAFEYAGPIVLPQSAHVSARAVSGTTWSALNAATYSVGPVAQSLRISELMYHPAGDPNSEYIELTNIGAETVNLNLVRFSNGVDLTFPSVELEPGQYVLVVRDQAAFEASYGADLPVVGQYSGSLNNGGERLALEDAAGQVICDFRYRDGWYDITDGRGFSLSVVDPTTIEVWDAKDVWRPSAVSGGSPGYEDSADVVAPGAVVINELLANASGDRSDWIELYNTTGQAIDIGGWFVSDDAENLMKYEIPAGTILDSDGYWVLWSDETFDSSTAPGAHEPFGLSRDGETVYLHSGAAGVLTGYSEQETFDASEPGVSLGRHLKSTGTVNFVALSAPTPGQANATPAVGPVVISEIMYHPAGLAEAEYVELVNIGTEPVTLYDEASGTSWRFTDDPDAPEIELLFPTASPVTLAPGGVMVLTKNALAFGTTYSVGAEVVVLEWGGGRLSDGGEKIQLSRPGPVDEDGGQTWQRVDRVVYSADADGQGQCLHRIDLTAYGNDPANWQVGTPTPGTNP